MKKIESELNRLKKLLGFSQELKVRWLPEHVKYSSGRRISGEVLGDVIYIYEENMASALATLGHEVIEKWVLDDLTVPYKQLINSLISAFEEDAYRRREGMVKKLCDVLNLERDENDDDR